MSSTARRMGLTQSAVSQLIANLELSLGVQLFDRQVRPIALTPSGVILLERAREILLSARSAIQAARQPADAAFPRLTLCLPDTVAGTIGADLVASIRGFAAHWSIHAGLSSQHRKALLSREADIIISPQPIEDELHLEQYEILEEPFCLALPKRCAGPVTDLKALAEDLEFIRFSSRSLLGRQIERHLRRLNVEARGRVEFDTSDSVLAMVTADLGWALLTPLCALLAPGYWPLVRFEPMPEPTLYRKLFVIARKGELGHLPQKIADIAAAALTTVCDAKLRGPNAWMRELMSIPATSRVLPETECIFCRARHPAHAAEPSKSDAPPLAASVRQLPLPGSTPLGKLARSS